MACRIKRAGAAAVIAMVVSAAMAMGQTVPAASGGAGTPGTATTGPGGVLHMTGQTEPVAKVEVPAGMKGQLASVDVKEGQLVKKGEQLAKLDDAIQVKQVELATLDAQSDVKIKAAENNLEFARNDYNRIKAVPAASEAEKRKDELLVRQYELEVLQSKEEQKQKQVKLEQEKITLDRMTIRSPIDGAVLRVNKQAGEQTDENPLIVVVKVDKLDAVFYPPKELFGKVKVGDKVKLDFATVPPTNREAVVVAVDPIIEQSLFRVKFEVDNADAKIPAGTSVVWNFGAK